MESQYETSQTIGLTNQGAIEPINKKAVDDDRYLSYIAHDNFESLNESVFSLGEVSNLLASTDHRQRLYAFDVLTKAMR